MKLEIWQSHVQAMAHRIVDGVAEALRLVSGMLHESDHTKEMLRHHGYGCTGMGLLETVKLVLAEAQVNVHG